ncbi:putative sterol carrier protein [Desulfitobacterium sp. LBE]|uniref:SCP2 sterol-binding domain-containing protein n=1 Tax=Desulfitobacterium sp. LBE TaxID=884086 RepID=UPI00119A94BB|nr:SCP2 sterol-binding domain-containing protein [Desulfitobacterium sp. LBE]TWH56872.1 putative sterol carrier protein [Desulfitobacterium sp. LBE]
MDSPKALMDDFIRKTEEKAELTSSINGVYQYDFSASDHGVWIITFENGKAVYTEGETQNPVVTIKAKFDTFVDFYQGKLNAMSAVMTGKIKIKGNMSAAMKMQQFL